MFNKKGFTLIELILVVSIIAVLIILFFPKGETILSDSKINKLRINGLKLENASALYFQDYDSYPVSGDVSTNVSVNTKNIINQQLYEKNAADTFASLMNDHAFKVIDGSKIKKYLKSNDEVGQYFLVTSGVLKGNVYSYETFIDKNKNVFSANYILENMNLPSSETTIRLPLIGDGSSSNPYVIKTIGELQGMRLCKSCYYELGKDIDASVTSTWNNGLGFEPIALYDPNVTWDPFTGQLNGKDFKIINLYVNRPSISDVGLFGDVYNATIQNLSLVNSQINGKNYVGGLSGYAESSLFKNIYVSSVVTASSDNSGGLVGADYYGTFQNVHVSTNLNSNGSVIGGFVGDTYSSKFMNSSSSGTVKGADHVGGFVGWSYQSSQIDQCFSSANVTAVNQVGGFAGDHNTSSKISNSYSTGNVIGTYQVGGFIGNVNMSSDIKNTYSYGKVTGSSMVGGLVGRNSGTATSTSSYWDVSTSTQSSSVLGVAKTTSEMKNQPTYSGWDFATIWSIDPTINNGYPYLKNNIQN